MKMYGKRLPVLLAVMLLLAMPQPADKARATVKNRIP